MKRLILKAALLAAALAPVVTSAAEVAGVTVDDHARVGNAELVLNGAGVRSKLFIKVYVGALYVTAKTAAAATLLDSGAPRRMLLRLMRDVDQKAMGEALQDGLKNNVTDAELAVLKPQVEQFVEILRRVGNLREADQLSLDFTADGVTVAHNGQVAGKVNGAAFARALLKVWLGDKPVDGSLKKALLGN